MAIQPLGRLRQPEAHSHIHEQHGAAERRIKRPIHALEQHPPRPDRKRREQHDKDEEGDGLEDEAGEEDVVGGGGVPAVRFGDADEGRAGDLHEGGNHVGGDEEP